MNRALLTIALIAITTNATLAQSNVDSINKNAWCENTGWTNWSDAGSPAGAQGVRIFDRFIGGYVWAENIGWISLGDGSPANHAQYANSNGTDFGVNIDPDGSLHGFAWGENVGWINFDGGAMASPPQWARVECDGRLNGMAWGENIGWINLSAIEVGKHVALLPVATPHACDMNRDGVVDGSDIQVFVNLLSSGGSTWRDLCADDLQAPPNNVIDAADVATFAQCLLGTP